jgi:hypothetical protein
MSEETNSDKMADLVRQLNQEFEDDPSKKDGESVS